MTATVEPNGMPRSALLALLVVAAAARVPGLGAESLWRDEIGVVVQARNFDMYALTVGSGLTTEHPPLYYVLLRLWLKVAGSDDGTVRALSCVFGCLAAVAVARLGARWFGQSAGIAAGILAAVSPQLVYLSREAGAYSLLLLTSVLSVDWFDRALQEGRLRWLIAYVVATLAMLYTHVLGSFVFAVEVGAAVLALPSSPRAARRAIAAALVVIAVFAPWLVHSLPALRTRNAAPWQRTPVLFDVLPSLDALLFWNVLPLPKPLPDVTVDVLAVALIGWGVALLLHRKPGLPAVITVAWLLVPFVAMVVVSYALVPIFGLRYTSHLAAPAALMIGYTLATLPSRALAASLLVALAVWQMTGVVRVHASYSRDQWREAAVWVGSREEPGDLILQVGFSPLNYYYAGSAQILSTRERGSVEGVTEATRSHPRLARRLIEPSAFALRLAGARRVWLIASEAPAREPAVDRALAAGFHRAEVREFNRVRVERYDAGS